MGYQDDGTLVIFDWGNTNMLAVAGQAADNDYNFAQYFDFETYVQKRAAEEKKAALQAQTNTTATVGCDTPIGLIPSVFAQNGKLPCITLTPGQKIMATEIIK